MLRQINVDKISDETFHDIFPTQSPQTSWWLHCSVSLCDWELQQSHKLRNYNKTGFTVNKKPTPPSASASLGKHIMSTMSTEWLESS